MVSRVNLTMAEGSSLFARKGATMSSATIRWSEALEDGMAESTLQSALEFHRHYKDDQGEVYWRLDDLIGVLDLLVLEEDLGLRLRGGRDE
jgi:hypothetical protein